MAKVGVPVVARWVTTRTDTLWFSTYAISDSGGHGDERWFIHIAAVRKGRTIVVVNDQHEDRAALRPSAEARVLRRMLGRLAAH